jgi:hypothetical protein
MLEVIRAALAMTAVGFGLLLLPGCGDSSDGAGAAGAAGSVGAAKTYLATGSQGDLIRYSVTGDHSYSYTNETTGQTGAGTYAVSSDTNMQGIYTVPVGGKTTYAIELADGIFVTSNPSGNASNRMVVGVPADQDLSVDITPAQIAGDFIYVHFSPSWADFAFGGYRLNADGTYTWGVIPMSADPNDPAFDFANYVHGGSAKGGGTWAVHPTEKSRIVFTETETAGQAPLTGTVHPGKAMLIDEGPGKGFTLGLRYPSAAVSQASLAGAYRFIDLISDGTTGVGWYSIPSSGTSVPWWEQTDDASAAQVGVAPDFAIYSRLHGVGYAMETVNTTEQYYSTFIVLPGEILMHFCYRVDVSPMQMISYGVGARIN